MPLWYSSFNLQSLYSVWQLEVISVICLHLKQGLMFQFTLARYLWLLCRNISESFNFNIVDLRITNQIGDVALGIFYLLR